MCLNLTCTRLHPVQMHSDLQLSSLQLDIDGCSRQLIGWLLPAADSRGSTCASTSHAQGCTQCRCTMISLIEAFCQSLCSLLCSTRICTIGSLSPHGITISAVTCTIILLKYSGSQSSYSCSQSSNPVCDLVGSLNY